ncbi:MAG: PIN domain-containing protein [Clostridiales bacterium]|nr:PIN domain-containing protein [Clostridiales bacterium]
MILVDTSVLIDFLKGHINEKTELFNKILFRDVPFGISTYTYQEVLQGAKDKVELEKLKEYLSTQFIYYLNQETATYERAAMLFFNLRRKGITPRSTIDILIALTAIESRLVLLHSDRDFDIMARHVPELKILNTFF